MSHPIDPDLLVPRTCTARDDQSGKRESRPLEDFRAAPAYVLLGDSGAGKTMSFKREADATGGHYLRARTFAALDHSPQLAGKTLFIDGLDEMRAAGGDGRTPLYQVRQHLDRLGRPPFRLSCREADWYGDSDSAALLEVAPGGSLAVLHLDPLSDADIAWLLERRFGRTDPTDFIRQAERHGLAELLRNPQTLDLLARAVGESWPDGRRKTYELACQQLVRETNPEHRAAKRAIAPSTDALLDAAGFLCAVHLLAGIAGFALDDDAADEQHALWRDLSAPREMPLLDALASGLFRGDDREQQRIPVHRSIAEFLGARHLAALIDTQGLPLGRVVALMAGEDGGIVPDLRGQAAWLSVHCRGARDELVGRDPLGVVLYGDVRDFPTDDKRRVLAALRSEAERYANFRFQDWTAAPFGALATPDMVPVFVELLASPSRSEADLALLDCALDPGLRKSLDHYQAERMAGTLLTRALETDWRREDAARKREWDKDREQRKDGWRSHFRQHLEAIRAGSAHPQILHELAEVYLRQHLDIAGETPRERLADFLGENEELIEAAYAGFRRSLDRDDLPSVAEIVELEVKGRMHFIRQPCLAGMEELYGSAPETALHLDNEVLRKLLAFRLTWVAEKESEWFLALVKARPALVAEVLVAYALPLLRKGREHLHGIWQLAYDDAFAEVARAALPDLLKGFPLRAKNQLLANALDPLLKAALRHLDRPALAAIVSARLAQGSMSTSQRAYWLACGLMISPDKYEMALAAHIGSSKALCGHLGAFLHDRERRPGFNAALPESSLALLIELLAPDAPPERPLLGAYTVTAPMQAAEDVRAFIDALGGNPSDDARLQLERLLALPKLVPWHNRLRHAAQTQRIARRKASFRHLDAAEVCRTLANREPVNAADLAALACAHLCDLARKIRDGSTNDYRQYWSYGADGKSERPKPENDCRDMLLSDLTERLGRLGVDAVKEGYYAEDKRADIRLFFGGFNVPIEIKKDSHSDLWRAIHEQLIACYTRDPGADGFGIYLVFWFGGNGMPVHPEGKTRSAAELKGRLERTLTSEESRRIRVCVIDCALPQKNQ